MRVQEAEMRKQIERISMRLQNDHKIVTYLKKGLQQMLHR
jgi:hypothetical protein